MEWGDKNDTETTGRWDALRIRATLLVYTFSVFMLAGWGLHWGSAVIRSLGWEWD